MKDCRLVEDLWPLYEEGLVQSETKRWIEEHVEDCPQCRHLQENLVEPIQVPESNVTPDQTIKKTMLKLHIYQMLLVVLSFIFAINTSMLSNQGFQFILSYFVLGIVVFYFYKNVLLTLLIAFVPTAIWAVYDTIISLRSVANEQEGLPTASMIVSDLVSLALFSGVVHSMFTALGILFVVLIQKAFEKGKTE